MKKTSFKALPFILFAIFSFGTGMILVTASQGNTEGRSKAAGTGPYDLEEGITCIIAGPDNPQSCNHCKYGPGGDEAAFEGQVRTCAGPPSIGDTCIITGSDNPLSCNHCQYGPGGDEAAFEGQVRTCGDKPVLEPGIVCFSGTDCNYCKYPSVPYEGDTNTEYVGQPRVCGKGNIFDQIGDFIELKLQQNGIGKGSTITCPAGQQTYRSPSGLTWCH